MKVTLLRSLRLRMPLLVLAGTVPLILTAIFYASDRATSKIREEAEENMTLKAQLLAESVERWNESNVLALHNLTAQPMIVSMNPEAQTSVLSTIAENYNHMYLAHTVNKDGQILARSDNKKPGGYRGDRYWFQGAMAGNKVTYQTLISRTIGKPALCLSAPIRQQKLIVVGVTSICTDLEALAQQVGQLRFGKTGYAFVVDSDGFVIAHPNPALISGEKLNNLNNYPPVKKILEEGSGHLSFQDDSNVKWFSHTIRLENGWGVVVLQEKVEFFKSKQEFQNLVFLVAFIAVLGVSVVTWLLANRLIQPITNLTDAAIAISHGQLDRRVEIKHQDELGILAQSFNQMATQLKSFFELLQYQVEERTAELKQAKEASLVVNQNTDKFLTNVSSDLHIFLNSILGYTRILKREGYLMPRQIQVLHLIEQSGTHLLTLINDSLDFSKTEAGTIELYPTELHLPNFVDGVANIVGTWAREKGLLFNSETESKLPTIVKADEKRLRQVLINLLSNAIKYTSSGEVTFRVSLIKEFKKSSPSSSPQQKLRFEVIDTGIGVNEKQLEKIYQPLKKIDFSQKRTIGNGLGLTTSREIIELMGSRLQVKSQLGKGSTFWFDAILPVVKVLPQAQKNRIEEVSEVLGYEGRRRKLLVVDDKEENRSLLFNLLSSLGFEVVTASNGEEMLTIASSIQPDLIFLDLFMPVKSGVVSIKELREVSELKNIPIILLSSSSITKAFCQYFGCEACLRKPIDKQQLLALLKQYLHLEWIAETQSLTANLS
ncbi:MAG: ATP-binding protein [Prochloraceae cyanobacterium]